MALQKCREPILKKLHPAGNQIRIEVWAIVGFKDDDGNYYERCKADDGRTVWYQLVDDDDE